MRDNSRKFVLRFLDKTSFVVTTLTAFTVLYTRSAGVIYFGAGAVACSASVKCVKQILQQARPAQTTHRRQKQTYGMPSTHSATIMFYATYVTLACAWLPLHASLPQSPFLRPFVALATISWAGVVASSRILLGYHTAPQVIVGCIHGFTFACVWFWPWTHGLSDLGHIVERHIGVYIER